MASFKVTLLRVEANSNPEDHTEVIEAKDEKEARALAEEMLAHPRGLGWRGYRDDALWGQVQSRVVSVEKA